MSGRKSAAPPPPTKPASAFFLWRTANYEETKNELLAKYGQIKGLTINKKMGKIWSNLDDKKKEKYQKQADKLKEKFDSELADYTEKYGEVTYRKLSKSKSKGKGEQKSKRKSKSKPKSKSKSAKGGCS